LEKEPEPRLAEAKEGKRKVYFADAVHCVLGSFPARPWCITGIFIPGSSGRKRYSVLGVTDAVTHELITVCNDTCINTCSVCELLQKVRDAAGSENSVTFVPDSAKYQKCALGTGLAEKLKIELLYLPSCSPGLNLTERLWNRIKKDCLNCKYYGRFDDFKEAINQSLQKASSYETKEEMNSLFALNFQRFDNACYNRA
jgi:transposase